MSDVRTRLIDASFQEIHAHGYNGASLATILKTANVKKGAMYHYFSSKKEMVLAMIDEKFAQRLEMKWQKLYHTNDDVLETLISILNDEKNWDFNHGCPVGNLFQESLDYDQDFSESLGNVLDNWQEQFKLILEKAKLEKQLRQDVDTQEVAMFIIAGLEGALLMNKKSNDPQHFQKCINQLTVYLNALRV